MYHILKSDQPPYRIRVLVHEQGPSSIHLQYLQRDAKFVEHHLHSYDQLQLPLLHHRQHVQG